MLPRLALLFLLLGASLAFATPYDTPQRLLVQRDDSDAGVGLVRDCYIWAQDTQSNGNYETLYTGLVGTGDKAALLSFDVSAVPHGASILGAQVLLHVTGAGGSRVSAHHITLDWDESAANWDTHGAAFDPDEQGHFTPAAEGPALMDVTGAVQAWVDGTVTNRGLMLRQVTMTSSSTYAGSEATVQSQRPMLEVWYELPSPLVHSTPSAALEASCGVQLRYGLAAHTPAATSYSVSGPDGLALDAASGELTWTPSREQAGAHDLTVKVSDAHGRASDLPVSIEVRCQEPLKVGCTTVPAPVFAPLLLLLFAIRRRR